MSTNCKPCCDSMKGIFKIFPSEKKYVMILAAANIVHFVLYLFEIDLLAFVFNKLFILLIIGIAKVNILGIPHKKYFLLFFIFIFYFFYIK